jgi:hypothetical protein
MPFTKRKVKILEAKYFKDQESILIIGECDEGKLKNQIHKNCFSYGTRSELEIDAELEKTAEMMVGKTIELVFDEELDYKLKENETLGY